MTALSNAAYADFQRCPFCDCHILEYGDSEIFDSYVYQGVTCCAVDCGAAWDDVYQLVGYHHKDNASTLGQVVFGKAHLALMAWDILRDIPVDSDDNLEYDFRFPPMSLLFERGTSKFEVWHAIEELFDVSIDWLMKAPRG